MTASTPTTATTSAAAPSTATGPRSHVWRDGAVAGVAAAAATTAIAAVALRAGVPVEVDGEQIPLAGFAQLTLFFTVIGLVIAKALARWAARPQRTFVVTTVVLTALSIVPDLTIPATAATKLVLIVTHLVAAAIVIPVVTRQLPAANR